MRALDENMGVYAKKHEILEYALELRNLCK